MSYKYYKEQLNQVNTQSEYAPKIKVVSGEGNGETKWMDLNKESATDIIEWLKLNILNKD